MRFQKPSKRHRPEAAARLRTSLQHSQKDSFTSSLMTGAFDQYVNAFAVFLGATAVQIGWLTALPQLIGALAQLLAVWLGQWWHRHRLIVVNAGIQTATLFLIMLLVWPGWSDPYSVLLPALVVFHLCANLILPHWRAWMGQLVPDAIRGRFFSLRTRIAMLTSLLTFLVGGLVLSGAERVGVTWLGFGLLFLVAVVGRGLSTWHLANMHDDHSLPTHAERRSLLKMFWHLLGLLSDRPFRRFVLFMAGLQCFVALSGPFFAVYMLRDLGFTYLQFTLSTGSSIFAQFLMLKFWGRVCDRKGNRYVMALGGALIPLLPMLWLFSDRFVYILLIQMLGGLAWSGFTLASSNYLYDQRPRDVHFASYAAMGAALGAVAVCVGALAGGYLIDRVPSEVSMAGLTLTIERPIAVIFVLSSVLRGAVMLWYLPRAPELRVRDRGRVRDLALRVARFTPISGVMLDVVNRRRRRTD